MADLVQASMEKMVPDFEALEEKGYFSKEELRQVINRRLHFEYLVKSRARSKEDFMSYIDYEMKLEELRELRWKDLPNGEPDQKKHRAHACIIRHIHGIFARATRCYKGDLELWMEWFQFCKLKRSNSRLSKAITEALRYNSHCPDLWIMAGQWEFNERANPHAARALMLLGIRMCKESKILWAEYFKMELVFAARLAARRQIMGIGVEKEGALEKEDDAMTGVIKGQAAVLVLQKALESFPASIVFRKQLLEYASSVQFPGCGDLIDKIFASIVKDFPKDAGAWDLRARHCYSSMLTTSSKFSSIDAAEDIYKEGLNIAPSEELSDQYYTFLDEVLQHMRQSKSNLPSGGKGLSELTIRMKMVNCCCLAAEKGIASEDLLLKWISLTNLNSGVQAALQTAQMATWLNPSSSKVWCSHLDCYWLSDTSRMLNEANPTSQTELGAIVEKAMVSVPRAQHCEVLLCALKILASTSADIGWIVSQVLSALKWPKSEEEQYSLSPVLCSILQILWRSKGIEAARTFYANVFDTFKCPEQFYLLTIALEFDLSLEDAAGCRRIKELLEKAVNSHPSSLVIWMKYTEFENMQGRGSSGLYSRAVQSLSAHSIKEFADYTKCFHGINVKVPTF